MSDVFISHVEEDTDLALETARGLEAAGYETWCYERDGYPGPDYLDQVDRAIGESQAILVVISPDSLGSQQVEDEVKWAREQQRHFVPILKGISWAEFQSRRPRWRMALGIATAVRVPTEGVGAILPRVVRGLQELGVKPSGTQGPIIQKQSETSVPRGPDELLKVAQRLYGAGDYSEAFRLFRTVAMTGNREAMIQIGLLYENGHGVAKDYAQARQWYEKAAAAGIADAMFDLGLLYENGQGVAKDYAQARQWYEKAAAAGSAQAMGALGGLYYNRQGVAQDYALARQWFERAAAAGNTNSMFNLGILYEYGLGAAQDYAQARHWYEKAAATGLQQAKDQLIALAAKTSPLKAGAA
jgi:TPR repeat protein